MFIDVVIDICIQFDNVNTICRFIMLIYRVQGVIVVVVCAFLTLASVSHVWHLIMANILCRWLGFAALLANCKLDFLRLQTGWLCSVCVGQGKNVFNRGTTTTSLCLLSYTDSVVVVVVGFGFAGHFMAAFNIRVR